MDVHRMMNNLGFKLGDTEKRSFPDSMKLKTLNNGQFTVANKLHPAYLSELTVIENVTATSGEYSLGSLNYNVLNGQEGILNVKIHSGLWAKRYYARSRKELENRYKQGSIYNPVYYVFNEKIFVENGQTNPSIDVYYIRQPGTMMYVLDITAHGTPSKTTFLGTTGQGLSALEDDVYNKALIYVMGQDEYHVISDYDAIGETPGVNDLAFTTEYEAGESFGTDQIYFIMNEYDNLSIGPSTTDASQHTTECELNRSVHELVVTFAAAECLGMNKEYDRRDAELERAEMTIKALNDQYRRASGIGTYNQK